MLNEVVQGVSDALARLWELLWCAANAQRREVLRWCARVDVQPR